MESSNDSDKPSTSEFIRRSYSRQSITSHHSRSSSVRQVNYGDAQVKPMKFGSRRSDSEGMRLSQKEISDEDVRFIYINDLEKTRVLEFCKSYVEQERSESLYVCGCPGTGKTMVMEKVRQSVDDWAIQCVVCLSLREIL